MLGVEVVGAAMLQFLMPLFDACPCWLERPFRLLLSQCRESDIENVIDLLKFFRCLVSAFKLGEMRLLSPFSEDLGGHTAVRAIRGKWLHVREIHLGISSHLAFGHVLREGRQMPIPGCVLLVHLGLNPHGTSLLGILLESNDPVRFTALRDRRRQELSFERFGPLTTLLSRMALRLGRIGRVALEPGDVDIGHLHVVVLWWDEVFNAVVRARLLHLDEHELRLGGLGRLLGPRHLSLGFQLHNLKQRGSALAGKVLLNLTSHASDLLCLLL